MGVQVAADESCEFSFNLNLIAAVRLLHADNHGFYEGAHRLAGGLVLSVGKISCQHGLQIVHVVEIFLHRRRVERHHVRTFGAGGDGVLDFRQFLLCRCVFFGESRLVHQPVEVLILKAVHAGVHPLEGGFQAIAPVDYICRQALPFGVVGADVAGDGVRAAEVPFKSCEHRSFDVFDGVACGAFAAAALLRPGAGDAGPPSFAVLDRHAAAATSAAQQAGQQPAWPPRLPAGHGLPSRQPAVRGRPQVGVDDGEVGGVGALPFAGWVGAAHPFAGVRVFDHPQAVPDQPADVDFVVEDAAAPGGVAVDGAGQPGLPPGRRDVVAVQPSGDIARRFAGGVFGKYPPHDGGFLGDDFPFPRPPWRRAVAVGFAAGVAAVPDHAGHAAPHLVGEILQIERTHQPPDADLYLIGSAVMDGQKLDPGKA